MSGCGIVCAFVRILESCVMSVSTLKYVCVDG